MSTYTPEQLREILDLHAKWLRNDPTGQRANLSDANLTHANLYGANLYGASLTNASLYGANLRNANLTHANLTNASLYGANLTGANLSDARSLWGAIGNMAEVKSIQADTWPVTYTATHMQIGCQLHPLSDWWAFDDEQIGHMDPEALTWWTKAKPMLRAWIEAYPAVGAQA